MKQEQFDEVQLGDIVLLKTAAFEQVANRQINTIPPTMIVVEVVREYTNNKNPHNSQTGKKEEFFPSRLKVKCLWYSQKLNKYITKWIHFDLLDIIQFENDDSGNDFVNGQIVCLKTMIALEYFLKTLATDSQDNEVSKDAKNDYLNKLLTCLPPKMIF